jgi:hypothetical protein
MSRIWRHKWVIVVSALVMALTLGTVAWAAGSGQGGSTAASAAVTTATGSTATTVAAQTTPLRDLISQRIERVRLKDQALIRLARGKMSSADKATLDQLLATAKGQRAVLRQARQDLGQTLKSIRDLVGKYTPTGAATTSTTVTTVAQ